MKFNSKYWATGNDFYQWKRFDLISLNDLDSWVALNSELTLSKIDPRYAVFFKSERIFFDDFFLFELRNLSPIRNNSIRFLANTKKRVLLMLDISNVPIYEMWKLLVKGGPYANILSLNEDFSVGAENSVYVYDYVKFFFNNVAGKHGRFEIVENTEDIRNRISTYYALNPFKRYLDFDLAQNWLSAFSILFSAAENLGKPTVFSFEEDLTSPSEAKLTRKEDVTIYQNVPSTVLIEKVLMVFKNNLFRASVRIDLTSEHYGNLELANEELGVLEKSMDGNFYYIKFLKTNDVLKGKTVEEIMEESQKQNATSPPGNESIPLLD